MKKSEELQEASHLVRTVAATLSIEVPEEYDRKFRGAILRRAAAEIAQIKPAFLIRLFESACKVDFPDEDVVAFRIACEKVLASHFDLSQYKAQKPASA